jgi:hypothetical protein
MRWPRVRFTVRRMMVAVAVVAVGLGALILIARSHAYSVRAGNHGYREWRCWEAIRVYGADPRGVTLRGPEPVEVFIDRSRRLAGYYATLRRKYEQAAARPWLPVEPDPPEPQ